MDPLKHILTQSAYHALGIVPMSYARADVGRILNDLPPAEARKMRRKFRKLWRKLARTRGVEKPHASRYDQKYRDMLGYGKDVPTKKMKLARKVEVLLEVQSRVNVAATDIRCKDHAGETPE